MLEACKTMQEASGIPSSVHLAIERPLGRFNYFCDSSVEVYCAGFTQDILAHA